MRKFIRDPFGPNPQIKEGSKGRFNIINRKLQFFHDKGETEPTKNHVVLDRKAGNKFFASVDVEAKFSGITNTSVGMILKKQDDKNYYAVELGSDKNVRFLEFKDGNRSVLKVKKMDERVDKKFNMAIDVQGPSMKFLVDGEEIFTAKDSTHKGGEFGFGSFTTTANFTNLEVYK